MPEVATKEIRDERRRRPDGARARSASEPARTSKEEREELGAHYSAGPAAPMTAADESGAEEERARRTGEPEETAAREEEREQMAELPAPESEAGEVAESAESAGREASERAPAEAEAAGRQASAAAAGGTEAADGESPEAATGDERAAARQEAAPAPEKAEAEGRERTDAAPADEEAAGRRAREEAGGGTMEMPEPGSGGEEAARLRERRCRLPTFAELKSVYESTTLEVPEKVIKDRVARILHRMKKDGTLKTKDDVPTLLGRLFPAPGTLDQAAFKALVTDVDDLKKIYKSVKDAEAPVKGADKSKLEGAIDDAVQLATDSAADAKQLKLVFGTKEAAAKTVYTNTATELKTAKTNMDTAISTDYNRDDPQTGLGGWAHFGSKRMHLELDVAQVKNVDETRFTLIHEGAHLADSSVDDYIYYPSKPGEGFEEQSEATKVANAAHFEEIPRRRKSKSVFPKDAEFKPGVTSSGGKPTFEQEVKKYAANYMREAWDRAVDMHSEFRDFRKEILRGGATPSFTAKLSEILAVSRLLGLTVHEQKRAHRTITQLDLTLTEGVARSIALLGNLVPSQTVKAKSGNKGKQGRKLIRALLKKHRELLGGKGWKIVRFMKRNYRKPL